MPSVFDKIVESADTPASKDDYIVSKGLRLVYACAWEVVTQLHQVLISFCCRSNHIISISSVLSRKDGWG